MPHHPSRRYQDPQTLVRLAWAMAGGELRHISEIERIPDSRRPTCRCAECEMRVFPILGVQRAHHFRHESASDCPAAGESALHLNTKYYLAVQLTRASQILIEQPCIGDGHGSDDCEGPRVIPWRQGWDRVSVEKTVERHRPDLLLERGGAPIAGIEVYATHAVPDDKAEALAAMDFPWLEVRADPALYTGHTAWTPERPFPFVRLHPSLRSWCCAACEASIRRHREEAERTRQRRERAREYRRQRIEREHQRLQAELARREQEARERERRRAEFRARLRRRFGCVLDLYQGGRPRQRIIAWIVVEKEHGVDAAAYLWLEYSEDPLARVRIEGGALGTIPPRLERRLEAWIRSQATRGIHVDLASSWRRARDLIGAENRAAVHPRYVAVGFPERWHPADETAPPILNPEIGSPIAPSDAEILTRVSDLYFRDGTRERAVGVCRLWSAGPDTFSATVSNAATGAMIASFHESTPSRRTFEIGSLIRRHHEQGRAALAIEDVIATLSGAVAIPPEYLPRYQWRSARAAWVHPHEVFGPVPRLAREWPRRTALDGQRVSILTIGRGKGGLDQLLGLLEKHNVDVLADLRAGWMSREPLRESFGQLGIGYAQMEQLGDGAWSDEYYDAEGYARYDRIAASDSFRRALGDVLAAAPFWRLALLGVEEDPACCVRSQLVGRMLAGAGVEVLHIRLDGRIETDSEAISRNAQAAQQTLFSPGTWRSLRPMRHVRGTGTRPT